MAAKKPSLTGLSAKRTTGKRNIELDALLSLGEVEEVDLSLVDRDEGQPRPIEEVMEGIESFADDIERDNFVLAQLPVYHIEPNGRRTIVVGERRTAAFRLKGKDKIPAICKRFTKEERERIFVLQYVENDTDLKKPLSPMADARWWRVYADRYHGGSVSAAAKARGKSQADISNRLTLLDAPGHIQSFVREAKLKDPATFAALVRLSRRAGDDITNQIMTEYRQGLIKGSFRAHIEALAKATKEGSAQDLEAESSTPVKKQPKAKSGSKNADEKSASKTSEKRVDQYSAGKPLKRAISLLSQVEFASALLDAEPSQYDEVLDKLAECIKILQQTQTRLGLERARGLTKESP